MSSTFWVNVWRGEDGEPVIGKEKYPVRRHAEEVEEIMKSFYGTLCSYSGLSYRLKVTIKEVSTTA